MEFEVWVCATFLVHPIQSIPSHEIETSLQSVLQTWSKPTTSYLIEANLHGKVVPVRCLQLGPAARRLLAHYWTTPVKPNPVVSSKFGREARHYLPASLLDRLVG